MNQRARGRVASNPCGGRHDDAAVGRAIRAAARGDRDASRYLYVRFADRVHAALIHAGVDPRRAESDTFASFSAREIARYRPDERGVVGWLVERARERSVH